EHLEDRTLLSTLDVVGGNLTYLATAAVNNNLTISVAGANYTFTDTAETITLGAGATGAGWTGSGTNTVTGPTASVTVAITSIELLDGTNTATVLSLNNNI